MIWIIKLIGLVGLLILLATLSIRTYNTLRDNLVVDTVLEEQHKVTQLIKQSGAKTLFVDGWWQNPEYQLLSGIAGVPARIGTTSHSQLLVFQHYQVSLTGSHWDTYLSKCSDVIYSSPFTLLCWPNDVININIELKILDWGPKFTQIRVVPNKQPDGGGGVWIKIEKINFAELGPITVIFSGILQGQIIKIHLVN